MQRHEVVDYISKNKYTASFFEDDSIDVVRHQIAISMDTHPDRLFILVGYKFPKTYYSNPKNWEILFERLSYNGSPLEKLPFQEYQLQYRFPNTAVPFQPYTKTEWMNKPPELKFLYEPEEDFIEFRILGVDDTKSYVLPLEIDTITSKIPAARYPLPENTKLISVEYPIERFMVRHYDEHAENTVAVYFPFFRSITPTQLSEETIRLLKKNAQLLDGLLKLEAPEPTHIAILRTRFYIPWIETDFGNAVRTRFEQIFYGLTVSSDVPYIGIFTSKDQVSRHKFYVEDVKNKKPILDMTYWNTWWSLTKPARSIPTLILLRGTSKHDFDRIAITERDMVVTTHRSEKSSETLEELQKSIETWIKSFDSILPFIEKADIHKSRWDLQDISFDAKYHSKLESFDTRRFNCISSIYDIYDESRAQFSLLRSDHANDGITAVEVKLLHMRKDRPLNGKEVAEELKIPEQEARELINKLELKIEEEPRLAEKVFRGYPTLRVGPDFIIMSSTVNLERSLKYANILRYILSEPDAKDIDELCPKRVEKVAAESIIPTTTVDLDAAIVDEISDLFGYVESDEPEETESTDTRDTVQKISTDISQATTYNYFKTRLQKFDPETFHSSAKLYPKKCEQKHQPISLSKADLVRLAGTDYDTSHLEKDKVIDVENLEGKIVCPEYWCMRDQIPLSESQLLHEHGFTVCPVCKGKLQTNSSDDPREFPLVKRETGFVYPGYVDYKSPKNKLPMPCCFKKSRANKNDKVEKDNEDKYYILGETKSSISQYRIAFLSDAIRNSLHIKEDYAILSNSKRLQLAMSGFFRVGMGHPAESLPSFLDLKTTIPKPRESIETVLKCSFLRSWIHPGTSHIEHIENVLQHHEPFKHNLEARAHISRLISGIDEAFEKKELSALQELEYSAIALNCDVFRINMDTDSMSCMFHTPIVRSRSRGIIVFQMDGNIDILSKVFRLPRGFNYLSNIFQEPFLKETYVEAETLRNKACQSNTPTFSQALDLMKELLAHVDADDFQIIMDPYGRGQAFYVPGKIILPFQPSILPDMAQIKVEGYSKITGFPTLVQVLSYLKIAEKIKGYKFREELVNHAGQVTEVLVACGLHIPIYPEKVEHKLPMEVIQTVSAIGEADLAFGQPFIELREKYKEISYYSEVYEFLLFQLSSDLQEDYRALRNTLQEVKPKLSALEPELRKWFDQTVQFIDIKKPLDFISKIRTPCGQFTKSECSGNICGWDGKVCRIQLHTSVRQEKLYNHIRSTLLENSKIRSIILDGRTTPFFSTILYLELPHELILTDNEI